jgi:hypothetical protein
MVKYSKEYVKMLSLDCVSYGYIVQSSQFSSKGISSKTKIRALCGLIFLGIVRTNLSIFGTLLCALLLTMCVFAVVDVFKS